MKGHQVLVLKWKIFKDIYAVLCQSSTMYVLKNKQGKLNVKLNEEKYVL
jgi:hypothetical protein